MKLLAPLLLALALPAAAATPVVPGIERSSDVPRAAALGQGILAKAVWCTKAAADGALPAECAVEAAVGAFGVSGDGRAMLVWGADTLDACATPTGEWSLLRRPLENGKLLDGEVIARSGACPAGADADACRAARGVELVRALAKYASMGWHDLPELVRGTLSAPGELQPHAPVAVLGAPLEAWMLALQTEGSGVRVALVSPDNRRSLPLDILERGAGSGGSWDRYGSVLGVSVAPDQSALILTAGFHDGGHCSPSRVRVERVWLSRQARALLGGGR